MVCKLNLPARKSCRRPSAVKSTISSAKLVDGVGMAGNKVDGASVISMSSSARDFLFGFIDVDMITSSTCSPDGFSTLTTVLLVMRIGDRGGYLIMMLVLQ